MKDHIQKEEQVWPSGMPLSDFYTAINDVTKGMVNVTVEHDRYEGVMFTGWVPMTARQKAARAEQNRRKRESTARKKEAVAKRERTQLERLAKKLGVEIKE